MNITGLHVDGFGIFHDQGLRDIPSGLVLFTGVNESGKTTLMQFIRAMMFGFPRKSGRDDRNEYEPVRGGNHGGRLSVVTQQGERFTIELRQRKLSIASDGDSPKREDPAERLLGGIDRGTFERVFAVSLEDMQGLGILDHEGVRSRVFAAGAGLGAVSIPATIKKLDTEIGNLLTARTSQHQINNLLADLERIERDLREQRGESGEYARLLAKKEELEARITAGTEQETQLQMRKLRLQQLEQAREPWIGMCAARRRAEDLTFAQDCPLDALDRYEELHERASTTEREKQQAETQLGLLEERYSHIELDEALLAHRDQIEGLVAERQKYDTALSDFPTARADTLERERAFQARIRDLGPEWDSDRLARVDTSVQVHHTVQEFAKRRMTADRELQSANERVRTAAEAVANANRVFSEATRRVEAASSAAGTRQELSNRRAAVATLRALLNQRDVCSVSLRGQSATQQEVEGRLADLARMASASTSGSVPVAVPLVCGLTAVGIGIVLLLQGAHVAAGAVVACGLLGTVWLLWSRGRQALVVSRQFSGRQAERETLEQRRVAAGSELASLRDQLRDLESKVEQVAAQAALDAPKSEVELASVEVGLQRAMEQLLDNETLEREKARAQVDSDESRAALERARQWSEATREELRKVEEEWERWLAERGFSSVTPEGFDVILLAIDSARTEQRHLMECRARVDQMRGYVESVASATKAALAEIGQAAGDAAVGVHTLDRLNRELHDAIEVRHSRDELGRELERVRAEASGLHDLAAQQQEAVARLLQTAGVGDVDLLRVRVDARKDLDRRRQEIESHGRTLLILAGTSDARAALEEELGATESLLVLEEKDRIERALEDVKGNCSVWQTEVGEHNNRLAQLSQGERLSKLLLERSTKQAELRALAKRWATLAICRDLVEQTRAIYERDRQPGVLVEAGNYLQVMTGEACRLVSPLGENLREIEDPDGRRRREIAWSSGLKDQVYLSVRLGLVEEFGRRMEPLPVILDDVLVRFDPDRQLGAAKVLLQFAQRHQVLLFSCHPQTNEVMLAACRELGLADGAFASFTVRAGEVVAN